MCKIVSDVFQYIFGRKCLKIFDIKNFELHQVFIYNFLWQNVSILLYYRRALKALLSKNWFYFFFFVFHLLTYKKFHIFLDAKLQILIRYLSFFQMICIFWIYYVKPKVWQDTHTLTKKSCPEKTEN